MKLAEALIERADKQRYLHELRARITRNAQYQEGEQPAEDPQELLNIYERVVDELEQLIIRINQTNNSVSLSNGTLMVSALSQRESLKNRHSMYKSLAEAATPQQIRYSQAEIKMVSAVNVTALQQRADRIAQEARELDIRIQQANWEHDLH